MLRPLLHIKRYLERGISLIELLVVMALMGIVTLSVGVMISKGVDYYLDSTNSVEIRQQLLFGTSQITRDLADSHIDVVRTEPLGIVIPTVRKADGTQQFDSKGRTLWQRYICYYIDGVAPNARLLKRYVDIPRDPSGVPHPLNPPDPPGGPGETEPPDPMEEVPPYDVAWFIANTTLPTKLVVRNLESFEALKALSAADADQLVTIRMAVSTRRRQKYQVGMETRVAPRH